MTAVKMQNMLWLDSLQSQVKFRNSQSAIYGNHNSTIAKKHKIRSTKMTTVKFILKLTSSWFEMKTN